ncbi:phage holin family protein [Lysobacter sp. HDW10]|uniref:phage holin family protein n=1 Tax=Lysobacter sp. HDW10 TaxID=2714936 RepID=UPI00140A7B7E|nr:phage holin family protein [Lysobacter sp. HDW10]QIK80527.1 phage holin family protein [Lysobacter sp. HDW10]
MEPGEHETEKPTPDLFEAFKEIRDAGKSGFSAFSEAGKSMRTLVAADVSLARSALGRTLALLGVAVSVGASAVLLLMGAMVAWLVQDRGVSLTMAMLSLGLIALGIAGLAAWIGTRYFEHTRMKATRRQLARLGIGELAERAPDPSKDAQGIDITQP